MNESQNLNPPRSLGAIDADTKAMGFAMASEVLTGALLRTIAASKPAGKILELGTGTGVATAWLLDGMDAESTLLSMDNDAACVAVARRHLGHDPRLTLVVSDGAALLRGLRGRRFDLIFADTWPGKYDHLDDALDLLAPGGIYVIDDLLPQPNWPADHAPKVPRLIETLEKRSDLVVTKLAWASGLILATRRPGNRGT